MKKCERLELLQRIILNHHIETQHELLVLLEKEGLHLTQATISRDINELGVVKTPTKDGHYVYSLSQPNSTVDSDDFLVEKTILSISEKTSGLEQMLHLDIIPGNTRLIKKILLDEYGEKIFSIIVDDDSLLLMAKSPLAADQLRQELLEWTR
ncbi:arginine repressor [Streptococcus sp. CSL10205-OR2]|uniref:arginine repressor n=1 Tax=Streptococcus sp. CSL10205-OR2 TaxID=2980558 RepID=UPI0021D91A16|nr:ArgR family transcriptional regulator [Streptococcus sp. CSL10205-OR2]MCU9534274.1 ArgR family transcriptional regulator [Streptococcus sp. CSL10205-OR2]